MDPFFDEKFLLTLSYAFIDTCFEKAGITALAESHTQSENNGICEDYCSSVKFSQSAHGRIYLSADSATTLGLITYLKDKMQPADFNKSIPDNLMMTFLDNCSRKTFSELGEQGSPVKPEGHELHSHEIVELPADRYRIFRTIFFLRDDEKYRYLGRLSLFTVFRRDNQPD